MGSAIRPLDLERRLVAAVHLHVSSQRTDPSGAEYVVPVEPGTAGRIPIWALDVSGNLSCYGYWRRSLQPLMGRATYQRGSIRGHLWTSRGLDNRPVFCPA